MEDKSITRLAKTVVDIIDNGTKPKPGPYDTQAQVVRIDGDTAYVHIPGGLDETPARKTIDAKAGDVVQVRVEGGSAYLIGNASNPPTDDTKANAAMTEAQVAWNHADSAREAADTAWQYADSAHDAADAAWNYADQAYNSAIDAKNSADEADIQARSATTSANGALTQLSTVENIIETLNWISEQTTFVASEDTTVDSSKTYYLQHRNYLNPSSASMGTVNGVDFTLNSDGTITANGTATADIEYIIGYSVKYISGTGAKLILSGCPQGGSASTYCMYVGSYDGTYRVVYDYGEGVAWSCTATEPGFRPKIGIKSGYTADNLVFKPMARYKDDEYTEYVPYDTATDEYCVVQDPTGNPSTNIYYELNTTDAVRDFVTTHLALVQGEGLYVLDDSSGWKVLISNTSVEIQNESGVPVAQYGSSIQIGKDLFSHLLLEYSSMKLKDFNGNTYMAAEDLRGESGALAETFSTGSGTPSVIKYFTVKHTVRSTNSVTADGTATAYSVSHSGDIYQYYLPNVTANQTIVINYNTNDDDTKVYTMGVRGSGTQGEMSFASGYGNTLAGDYSEAGGYGNAALGEYTHIEGYGNSEVAQTGTGSQQFENNHIEGKQNTLTASMGIGPKDCHVEGVGCEIYDNAEGYAEAAHVQNYHTVARYNYQTAIGKYNSNSSADLFEIGNGTADNARRNAFAVDQSGNVNIPSGAKYKINGTALAAADVSAIPTSDKYNRSAVGGLDWGDGSTSGMVTTKGAIAFWNGSYDGATSNLQRLNGTVYIGGTQLADFVIEQGTKTQSGIAWIYRKWNSGKVEAWTSITWASQTPAQWVTNLYYKDLNTVIPSGIFSAVPSHVTATTTGADNNLQWTVYSTRIYDNSGTYSVTLRFTRPNSTAGAIKASIFLYS